MVALVRDVQHVCRTFATEYSKVTSTKLKLIDSYTVLCLATALIQVQMQARSPVDRWFHSQIAVDTAPSGPHLHAYMLLMGSFPFNAYLAAVIGCIGSAVFSVCLRMQLDDAGNDLPPRAPERAYADFILAHLALFFIVWNYVG